MRKVNQLYIKQEKAVASQINLRAQVSQKYKKIGVVILHPKFKLLRWIRLRSYQNTQNPNSQLFLSKRKIKTNHQLNLPWNPKFQRKERVSYAMVKVMEVLVMRLSQKSRMNFLPILKVYSQKSKPSLYNSSRTTLK